MKTRILAGLCSAWLCVAVFAQNFGTSVIRVDTLADLVAAPVPTVNAYLTAIVAGNSSATDGGGGIYSYIAGSAAATNSVTILKPTATTGRWIRQFSSTVGLVMPNNTPVSFQAVGGDPDDTIKKSASNFFQLDIQAARITQSARTIWTATGDDNVLYIRQNGAAGQSAIAYQDASGNERMASGVGTTGAFWGPDAAGYKAYTEIGDPFNTGTMTRYRIVTSGPTWQYPMMEFLADGAIQMFSSNYVATLEPSFFLDETTGNIGIFTTTNIVDARLQISHPAVGGTLQGLRINQATNNAAGAVIFNSASSVATASDGLFRVHQAGTSATWPAVTVRQDGTGDILRSFKSATQLLTQDNTGQLGIGTATSPSEMLETFPQTGTDESLALFRNTGGGLYVGRDNSTGSHVSGSAYANVLWDVSSNALIIGLGNAKRATFDTSGNLILATAGGGLRIKEGSNARMGTAALVNGTVTVANTSVTASTRIFLTRAVRAGTTVGILGVGTVVAATSFVIESVDLAGALSADDDSTVNWLLVEPSP